MDGGGGGRGGAGERRREGASVYTHTFNNTLRFHRRNNLFLSNSAYGTATEQDKHVVVVVVIIIYNVVPTALHVLVLM